VVNITEDLKENVYKDVRWIHLDHDRVQYQALENTVMKFHKGQVITVVRRTIPSPCQDSNPPIIQPVA
jgi:hypothetical protein